MARLSNVFLKKDRARTEKIWEDITGVPFLIGSFINPDYVAAVNAAPEDASEDFYNELFAEYILLGWKNLEDDDDNVLEPTLENRKRVAKDYPELSGAVVRISKNSSKFIEIKKVEDDLGNSKASPDGL